MKSNKPASRQTVSGKETKGKSSPEPKATAKKTASATKTTAPAPGSAKPVKKTAAKKQIPEVPSILLEGDHSSTQGVRGPGQKFALGPAPVEEHFAPQEETGQLPEAYGTKTLLLTARDPHWLYAHWDLTREQLKEFNARSRDKHLLLRVFVDSVRGEPFAEVHLHPESRNWFVHVGRGGTKFVAELGYYQKDGNWMPISISGATLTPPDKLSENVAVYFQTIPHDIPFTEILKHVQEAAKEHLPLALAIQELRALGFTELPDAQAIARGPWTPLQEEALAKVISMDRVRRVWMGSLEITELLRRQLGKEWSSAAAAEFSRPWSLEASSLSSPYGGERARGKQFWFNVNAELIIYGATEPDAEVTIGGRRIKLRADGTFSYRFSLPDGKYELPAIATSADGDDSREASLKFSRQTDYQGDVGAHPQSPELKTPHPAHVA